MRFLKLIIPFLSLLIACNNNTTENQGTTQGAASPANRKFSLAYRNGDEIVVTSIDTMKQISFNGATDPAISPDGTKLAYTISDSAGHRSIWVADLERKEQAQLPVANDNFYQAMWSPSGDKIAFSIFNKDNRWKAGVMNTDHSGYRMLDSTSVIDLYSPTWKNENELIGHDLINLYTLDLSGKVTHSQPLESLIGKDLSLSSSSRFFYTKDGKNLIFNAGNMDIVENPVGPNEAVYVLDLASKKISRISPEGFNAPYVYVTADDEIFYSASRTTDSNFKIYAGDLKGNVKVVVEKGMSPTGALK